MERSHPYRPRVSRETRLLLTAAVSALAVLWLLARVRYPDRPATPNPLAPVLTQIGRGPTFDALASEMSDLQPQLERSLVLVETATPLPLSPALRIREDIALTLVPLGAGSQESQEVLAHDPASGLTLVRVPAAALVPPTRWVPRRPQEARYLVATDLLGRGISLRPVFVGGLEAAESPAWPDLVWALPGAADLVPGSFVFTNDAELAGLVVQHARGLAIVPSDTLLVEADRLLDRTGERSGEIDVLVQALTPSLSVATGAKAGVVVAWVDRQSVVADTLSVGDVIESFDGQIVTTPQHWDVHLARLIAGDTFTLQVRRHGESQALQVVAPARPALPIGLSLGLTMRRIAAIGTEIVRVEPGSVAARSGLVPGDIITVVGTTGTPTPAQVRNTLTSAPTRQPVLIAVTRGATHQVLTLTR